MSTVLLVFRYAAKYCPPGIPGRPDNKQVHFIRLHVFTFIRA